MFPMRDFSTWEHSKKDMKRIRRCVYVGWLRPESLKCQCTEKGNYGKNKTLDSFP